MMTMMLDGHDRGGDGGARGGGGVVCYDGRPRHVGKLPNNNQSERVTMHEITTRADLFRALTPGTVLTMTAHDWYPHTWMIGIPRVVTIQQTERIALETTRPDGETVDSWMSIPKASDVRIDGPDTFSVRLSPDDEWMTYRLGN